jgi:pimeloyl-ACP methyl ester carboxylesterase
MKIILNDGVHLAFDDIGVGSPIVLVHGFACDHRFFARQIEGLSSRHRVIAVDLRGHGISDAPQIDYTMQAFAADLAWLCGELELSRPVIVGHSMGGNVALEFAARYPDLARGILLIDSQLFAPEAKIDFLRAVLDGLRTDDYQAILRRAAAKLFISTDDPARKEWILTSMAKTSWHVLVSAFQHMIAHDAAWAVKACSMPLAYIGAACPLGDVEKLKAECPNIMTAQTLGAGHFSILEVPDQINSMIAQFVALNP